MHPKTHPLHAAGVIALAGILLGLPLAGAFVCPGTCAAAETIVIDPGHGGADAGISPPGLRSEKENMLALALDLEQALRRRGAYRVVLTRTQDVTVPMVEAQADSNRSGAEVFLALHQGKPGEEARLRLFVNRRLMDEALVRAVKKQLGSGVRIVPWDFAQNPRQAASRRLAERIGQAWQTLGPAGTLAGQVLSAPIAVLSGVQAPAVLAEIPDVGRGKSSLENPAYRQQVAERLADGVAVFLSGR